NRMTETLGITSSDVIPESSPTKMAVIADGSLITNQVDYASNPPRMQEMGMERSTGQVFANREFLLNTVFYLNDDQGIMHLRNRTQKLRLLDRVRLREELSLWQWLNVLLPLVLVGIWGVFYNTKRRYRYNRS